MTEAIWDASAVLALLHQERGWEELARQPSGAIGAVDLSEVVAKLAGSGMPDDAIRSALAELALEIHGLDEDQAIRAGLLRPTTRHLGLSLGDRCCLALGAALGLPVLTTDRRWRELSGSPVEIRVVR